MLRLNAPARALSRSAKLRFPVPAAPSRFSSTSTTEAAPSSTSSESIPPPPASYTSNNSATTSTTSTSSSASSSSSSSSRPEQVNYFVSRTPSHQLPVYESKIRGGSVAQTKIRKVEGNVRALKQFLQAELGVPDDKIRINPRNNHIDIRGKHKAQVDKLLESRGF